MSYDLGRWDEIGRQVDQFQDAHDNNSYFVAIKAKGERGELKEVRCLSSNAFIRGFQRLAIWFKKPKDTELIYGRASEDNAASRFVLDSLGRHISQASVARSDDDHLSFMQRHHIKHVDDISAFEERIKRICAKHAALAKPLQVAHVTSRVSMDRERAILLDVKTLLAELNQQVDTIMAGPKNMQQVKEMLNLLHAYLGDTRFVEVLNPKEFLQLEGRLQQVMDRLIGVLEEEASQIKSFDQASLRVFQEVQRQFQELKTNRAENVSQASSKSWAAHRLQTHCLQALGLVESSHFQAAVHHVEALIKGKEKEIESCRNDLAACRDQAGQMEASAQGHRHLVLEAFNQFEETLAICSSPAFNSIGESLKGQLAAVQVKFDAYKQAIENDEMTFDQFMNTGWLDSLRSDVDALAHAFAEQPLQGPEQKVLTDRVEREQELVQVEKRVDAAFIALDKTQQEIDRMNRFQLDFHAIKQLIDGFGKYVKQAMGGDSRATLQGLIDKMSDPTLSSDELIGMLRANIRFFSSHGYETPLLMAYHKVNMAQQAYTEAMHARAAFLELRTMMDTPGLTDEAYLKGIEQLLQKYDSPFFLLSYRTKGTLETGRAMLAEDERYIQQDAIVMEERLSLALADSKEMIVKAAPKMQQMEKDLIDIFTYHKAIEVIDQTLPRAFRRKEKDYAAWPEIHDVIQKLEASDRGVIEASLKQIWSMDSEGVIGGKVQSRELHEASMEQLKAKLAEQQAGYRNIKQERDAIGEDIGKLQVAYRALTKDREDKLQLLNSLLESLNDAKGHCERMAEAHQQVATCHFEIARMEEHREKLESELMQSHSALAQIRQAQTLEVFADHLRAISVR